MRTRQILWLALLVAPACGAGWSWSDDDDPVRPDAAAVVPIDAFEPDGPFGFAPQQTLAVGAFPNHVAIGDLDHDGLSDLAVANNTGKSVGVLLATDGGGFAPHVAYASSSFIGHVRIGDMDGNSTPDLVDEMGLHLNAGNGTFGPERSFGAIGTTMALADFNVDGRLDIAIIQPGSRSLHIVLATGNGMFAPKVTYMTGVEPLEIATGDVNGDGKPDVVISLYGSSTVPGHWVDVHLNAGNGTFLPHVEHDITVMRPAGIALADVNGDGALDAIATSLTESRIGLSMGNGDGTFDPAVVYPTPGTWNLSVAAGDIDGDGSIDLAVSHGMTKCVGVYLNHGDGTFAPGVTFATGNEPSGVAIGLVDGNARPDLVVTNRMDNTLSVLLQTR